MRCAQQALRGYVRGTAAPAGSGGFTGIAASRRAVGTAAVVKADAKPTAATPPPPPPALPIYDLKAVKDVVIGVPGETAAGERRVAGTPESLALVRERGSAAAASWRHRPVAQPPGARSW